MKKKDILVYIMDNENIVSPCISICKSDPISDYCYGCGRTSKDKKMWNDPTTSKEWKKSNLELIKSRLSSWQKEAWDKSYNHKINTGNSLFKEKILKQKK
tara:strand:- start:392 stop:691 length:300 start_codon:yes stop_codon:yes gene_type:complete